MCVLGLRVCVFANISSVYRICVCSVMRRMKLILLHRFCFNYFNLHSDGEKKSECFKKYKCILITFIQLIPIRPLLKFWLRVMNAVLAISETLAPYSVPASCTGSPLVRGSLMSAWRPRFCLCPHTGCGKAAWREYQIYFDCSDFTVMAVLGSLIWRNIGKNILDGY